jgi:DNA-binding Lrp family transcriptional regulator
MLDAIDRRIVAATQDGLPLVPDPYRQIARAVGTEEADVIARLTRLLARGAIRRIGAVPNHYALGLRANGMSVWDVEDDAVAEVGRLVGDREAVTHCYERPRRPPVWPYNLFAMVHGGTREDVRREVARIAALIGTRSRRHDVLFSTRLLKKTGLRIAARREEPACSA